MMTPTAIEYLVLFLASTIGVGILTPLMRVVALRFGIVDKPNQGHKTHLKPIPYLGGVAIMVGTIVVTYIALFIDRLNENNILLASQLLIPAFLMGLVGLIDDIKNLSPWPRFMAQTATGLVTASLLIKTNTIGSPTGSAALDAFITVLWIVGITNSINFFDNVDGGASGTVSIASLGLFVLAIQGQQYFIAALAIVLSGSTIGFLSWNRPPARIYMGDAGALFLGFLIASLVVRLDTNPINEIARFSIPLLILAVPILDTCVAVVSRIRRGISPFQGGRDHLSHRLMRMGLTKRQSVIYLWALTALFVLMAIALSFMPFKFEGIISLVCAASFFSLFLMFMSTRDS